MFKNTVDWESEALAEPQTRIQRPAQQELRPPQSCRHKFLHLSPSDGRRRLAKKRGIRPLALYRFHASARLPNVFGLSAAACSAVSC